MQLAHNDGTVHCFANPSPEQVPHCQADCSVLRPDCATHEQAHVPDCAAHEQAHGFAHFLTHVRGLAAHSEPDEGSNLRADNEGSELCAEHCRHECAHVYCWKANSTAERVTFVGSNSVAHSGAHLQGKCADSRPKRRPDGQAFVCSNAGADVRLGLADAGALCSPDSGSDSGAHAGAHLHGRTTYARAQRLALIGAHTVANSHADLQG